MCEWSSESIYNSYVGWFDGDPVKCLPTSTGACHLTVLAFNCDIEMHS